MISLHRPAQLLSLPHSGFSIFLACSLAHVLTDLLAGSVCFCCSSAVVGTPTRTSASRFRCKINVLSQAYMSSPTGTVLVCFLFCLKTSPTVPYYPLLMSLIPSYLFLQKWSLTHLRRDLPSPHHPHTSSFFQCLRAYLPTYDSFTTSSASPRVFSPVVSRCRWACLDQQLKEWSPCLDVSFENIDIEKSCQLDLKPMERTCLSWRLCCWSQCLACAWAWFWRAQLDHLLCRRQPLCNPLSSGNSISLRDFHHEFQLSKDQDCQCIYDHIRGSQGDWALCWTQVPRCLWNGSSFICFRLACECCFLPRGEADRRTWESVYLRVRCVYGWVRP